MLDFALQLDGPRRFAIPRPAAETLTRDSRRPIELGTAEMLRRGTTAC